MKIPKKLKDAFAVLPAAYPFHAAILFSLRHEEVPMTELVAKVTGSDDGQAKFVAGVTLRELFYDPEGLDRYCEDVKSVLMVLCHEAEHIARLHPFRMGDRDPRLWNIACDFVINASLHRLGLRVTGKKALTLDDITTVLRTGRMDKESEESFILLDPSVAGKSEEEIYDILTRACSKCTSSLSGASGEKGTDGCYGLQDDGGGHVRRERTRQDAERDHAGGHAAADRSDGAAADARGASSGVDPERAGGDVDRADALAGGGAVDDVLDRLSRQSRFDAHGQPGRDGRLDERERVRIGTMVAAAYRQAMQSSKMRGLVPAGIDDIVAGFEKARSKVDWRRRLYRFFNGLGGMTDWSYASPSRWSMVTGARVLRPGEHRYGLDRVVFAIDTSASMSNEELAQAFAELKAIMRRIRPNEIWIIEADADVAHERRITLEEMDNWRFDGKVHGRGGTSFTPTLERAKELRPTVLVYITDGMGDSPEKPPFPVLWVTTTGTVSADFGTVIDISKG